MFWIFFYFICFCRFVNVLCVWRIQYISYYCLNNERNPRKRTNANKCDKRVFSLKFCQWMDKMGRLLLRQQNSTHPTNQHCWKLYNFSYWINLCVWDEGSKQNGCLPLKIEKPSYSYECTKITKYNTNIAFFGHNNKIHNCAENKRTKANYLNQKPKRLGERATVVLSEHQVLAKSKNITK